MQRSVIALSLAVMVTGAPATFAQPTVAHVVLTPSDAAPGDAFGRSVALSGDTLIVGANGDDERGENAGAAYVFVRDASGAWRLQQKLLSWLQRPQDFFGWSVDVDGDTAVVGAPGTEWWRGAVYVFVRAGDTWYYQARLQPDAAGSTGRFGWRVALDQDILLASAPWRTRDAGGQSTRPGGVWAYLRSGTSWHLDAELVGWGMFGFSLDLRDGIAAIGGLLTNRNDVDRYERTAEGWRRSRHALNTAPAADGVAEAARFVHGWWLDAWVDDSVVVLDDGALRLVDETGVVRTIGRISVKSQVTAFAVGRDGTLWWAEQTNPSPGGTYSWELYRTELLRWQLGDPPTLLAVGAGYLTAIEPDSNGGLFLPEGCRLVHMTATGARSTVAGGSECATVDGPAASARFAALRSLALSADGLLYVGDGRTLRRVTLATGHVDTVAGRADSVDGPRDGIGTDARFGETGPTAVDPGGAVWVADGTTLRRIDPSSAVTTVAGVPRDTYARHLVDGVGSAAVLDSPSSIAVAFGGRLAFTNRGAVRVATPSGVVHTTAGVPEASPFDDYLSYAVALGGNRLLSSAPRSTQWLGTRGRVGMAWLFEPGPEAATPSTPVFRTDAPALSRLGAAVTFIGDRDIALGPANGCLWVGHDACGDDAYGLPEFDAVSPIRIFRERDGLWIERTVLPLDGVLPRSGYGSALASGDTLLVAGAPEWDYRPQDPWPLGDILGPGRVFVYDLSTLDSDGDTLPDDWEGTFGLDPTSALGDDGAGGDPDHDGRSNAEELAAHTHPRNDQTLTRYFAEGAASDFFETELAIANPGDAEAIVNLRFMKAGGELASSALRVPARQSRKTRVSSVAGMARAEFSTQVESDRPVAVDRLMWWDRATAYGSHGERALASPATTWYLAEGATHSGFELFYLVQNPNDVELPVRVRYLRPDGPPLEKTYAVAARSRFNIWVNQEEFPDGSGHRALASTEVSAVVAAPEDQPIVVERAMYRTPPGGPLFEAGHESAGVTVPATQWFFAEGATGDVFDVFFLVANPGDTTAQVRATFLLEDGRTFAKTYDVAPQSRFNIWVDREQFDGHAGFPLADAALSTTLDVLNGVPIVAERAMWWPGPTSATWTEAHASAGATTMATRWVAGAGEVRDTPRTDTYYLIANPTPTDAYNVRVALLFDDGTGEFGKYFKVPAFSRFNVDVRSEFPEAIGKRFGVYVYSMGYHEIPGTAPAQPSVPIVVEWAIYSDALGQRWAAGANALATVVSR